MIAFKWTDDAGVEHILDNPRAIEDEYEKYRRELLALSEQLQGSDDVGYLKIRPRAVWLRKRLADLAANLADYNLAWEKAIRTLAIEVSATVGGLISQAEYLEALHECYRQYQRSQSERLAYPTPEQIKVLREQAIRERIDFVQPRSFAAAHAQLLCEPTTNRQSLPDSVQPFEWQDLSSHYHQIRTVMPIELEYIGQVQQMIDLLEPVMGTDSMASYLAIEKIRLAIFKVNKLQKDMEAWTAFIVNQDRIEMIEAIQSLGNSDGHVK